MDACYFSVCPVYALMELKGVVVESVVRMTFIVSLSMRPISLTHMDLYRSYPR
jgi:hypothetical protein